MFKNFLSEEAVKELVDKLLPLYPHKAEQAVNMLLEEYKLPIHVAYMIMSLVHIQKNREELLNWPLFDASYRAFGLN